MIMPTDESAADHLGQRGAGKSMGGGQEGRRRGPQDPPKKVGERALDAIALPSYLRAHSARPEVVNRTVHEAVRRDLGPLMQRLLADVGIEYVLRHCFLIPSGGEATAGHTLFWVAAYHDAGSVLDLLAEACLDHFTGRCGGDRRRAERALTRLLDAPTEAGSTPLLVAAARDAGRAVAALTKHGADPNSANAHGATAAAIAASLDGVAALSGLGRHADTDFNCGSGAAGAPVLAACRSGAVGALRFLYEFRVGMEFVVDFNRCDREGYGPVALAAKHDRAFAIAYLSEVHDPSGRCRPMSPDINARFAHPTDEDHPSNGDTPLHTAVRCDSREAVKALLRSPNCDFSARNLMGMTPLHVAAVEGRVEIAERFLQELPRTKLDLLDSEDISGKTPLYLACEAGHTEMVGILAKFSDAGTMCLVEGPGSDGGVPEDGIWRVPPQTGGCKQIAQPALLAAARNDHPGAISALIAAGADINVTDELGHTAVSIAARMGLYDVCEVLAKNGADLAKRSSKGGGTPLQKAKKYGHRKIVGLLESFGGS